MEKQYLSFPKIVSIVVCLCFFSPALCSDVVDGVAWFQSDHGLIVLPEDVIGALFDYEGLNFDSLMGDTLDLSLITEAFVYLDSTSYNFSEQTLDEFKLSGVNFTDLLLKWQIESIKKMFPEAVEYDTVRTNRLGRKVIISDVSLHYIVEFADTSNIDSVIADLDAIDEVVFAAKDIKLYEQDEPTDPLYENGNQWQLNNTSYPDYDINPVNAWTVESINCCVRSCPVLMGCDLTPILNKKQWVFDFHINLMVNVFS